MTSPATVNAPATRLPAGRYPFSGVARMEWIKLRSLRSTRWTALILAVAMTGIAILVLRYYPSHWARMSAKDKASFDPVNDGYTGLALAQLIVGALGALAVTSEYSSGMIRATLAACPGRWRLLAAKAAVFAAAALLLGEALSFATFLAGQAVLSSPVPHATLGQPGVLRAVLLAGAYLCLIGLIGMGIGTIVRHSAAAIAVLVGVVLVLPPILLAFPTSVQHSAQRYLPELIAENSLTSTHPVVYSLSPWAGLGMLCLYAAALLGAGGWLLARRDA
jgi:ABC-type transport system involved in multi-copper enzyme maturation permease subunit